MNNRKRLLKKTLNITQKGFYQKVKEKMFEKELDEFVIKKNLKFFNDCKKNPSKNYVGFLVLKIFNNSNNRDGLKFLYDLDKFKAVMRYHSIVNSYKKKSKF